MYSTKNPCCESMFFANLDYIEQGYGKAAESWKEVFTQKLPLSEALCYGLVEGTYYYGMEGLSQASVFKNDLLGAQTKGINLQNAVLFSALDRKVGELLASALSSMCINSMLQDLILDHRTKELADPTLDEMQEWLTTLQNKQHFGTMLDGKVVTWNINLELADAEDVWGEFSDDNTDDFNGRMKEVLKNSLCQDLLRNQILAGVKVDE